MGIFPIVGHPRKRKAGGTFKGALTFQMGLAEKPRQLHP